MDLDVKTKAVILGACFLIVSMIFQISLFTTLVQIEFQSDDVTKMIFLKLWVSFDCSEQPI